MIANWVNPEFYVAKFADIPAMALSLGIPNLAMHKCIKRKRLNVVLLTRLEGRFGTDQAHTHAESIDKENIRKWGKPTKALKNKLLKTMPKHRRAVELGAELKMNEKHILWALKYLFETAVLSKIMSTYNLEGEETTRTPQKKTNYEVDDEVLKVILAEIPKHSSIKSLSKGLGFGRNRTVDLLICYFNSSNVLDIIKKHNLKDDARRKKQKTQAELETGLLEHIQDSFCKSELVEKMGTSIGTLNTFLINHYGTFSLACVRKQLR